VADVVSSSPMRPARVTGNGPAIAAKAVRRGIRTLARLTPWVEDELLGLHRIVRPGDVCLDVGAALGLYTAELAVLTGPGGVVHSIEPLLFAHPIPAAVLGLRRGPNVRRHGLALTATGGKATMSVPLRNGRMVTGRSFVTRRANGLGANEEFDEHVEVTVPTERLDRFCERLGLGRVDFVKADVEGAEWDVLRGGERVLAGSRPALLLEIEARHLLRFGSEPRDLADWLVSRYGYRMFVWHEGDWRQAPAVTGEHRNYLFSTTSPGT
jgi:FkbM family methyltransferase